MNRDDQQVTEAILYMKEHDIKVEFEKVGFSSKVLINGTAIGIYSSVNVVSTLLTGFVVGHMMGRNEFKWKN